MQALLLGAAYAAYAYASYACHVPPAGVRRGASGRVQCCDVSAAFADGAAAHGMLRPNVLQQAEAGSLWDGPSPDPGYSPLEVIELTLQALRHNADATQPHAGTALLRRFSSECFVLAGEPQPRVTPPELTAFFESSQYDLLLESHGVTHTFPSDECSFDNEAWQEVVIEDARGDMLAKLGWSLIRRADGCWVTCSIAWHDFRDEHRPGIGQVEWDRSFG
jgi:hypothetical protein